MPRMDPLISVVIVCKNPGGLLRRAVESVWSQVETNPDLVIIDGGSDDGTVAWLNANQHRFGFFSSALDSGIYDAMNRGVAATRGEWILFLGADDCLEGGSLDAVAGKLREDLADVVVGEAVYADGRVYRLGNQSSAIRRNFLHHQAAFYRRCLFNRHGGFDASLSVAADYDFNLRLLRAGCRFLPISTVVSACGVGGISDAGRWISYGQEISVRHRHFPVWRCWFWDLAAMVRYFRKRMIRILK